MATAEIIPDAPFGRRPVVVADHLSFVIGIVCQVISILGKSGAGKSYLLRRFIEQLLGALQQVVILDPKGDAHGLRTSARGDAPGFPIVILGGNRGDAPIDPESGAHVAEVVVSRRMSILLDLSHLRREEMFMFTRDFLDALYRLKARAEHQHPLMLVIDEADAVAPQRPPKGAAEMLAAADDIVRRGRQRGIGVTLATQRAATVSKNVLSQTQVLFALRTIAPADIRVMRTWVEAHATPAQLLGFTTSLATLPRGESWCWSPGWPTPEGVHQRIRVLPIETFDSGSSPLPGEPRVEPAVLAPVDADLVALLAGERRLARGHRCPTCSCSKGGPHASR
jgi:uncharacterized protein